MKFLALDFHGRPTAHLLAEDYLDAMLFVHRGCVPGARDVIGDNAYSAGDVKAVESKLVATFRAGGLSEAEARVAARGRERDRPVRDFLPTIRVPYQSATTRSSSAATPVSERESIDERARGYVELREPSRRDHTSELTELDETLNDLASAFRGLGLSETEARTAARGRDYRLEPHRIREDSQAMGEETPIAYARRMDYPAPDGSVSSQWKIDCPWCQKMHLSPGNPTTEQIAGMLGPQAMLCGLGTANVVDAATTPPPEFKTTRTVVPSGEAARDRDGLAEAEERLYASFRADGLSETAARVAARGRNRR